MSDYPRPICKFCGEECDRTEVVTEHPRGTIELWCYCEPCDASTCHPIPACMKHPAPGERESAGSAPSPGGGQ